MKSNKMLIIAVLVITALIILLAGTCKKDETRSSSEESGHQDKTTLTLPDLKEAADEQMETTEESMPEYTAPAEQTDIVISEKSKYLMSLDITPEEALSASFHGQIEYVLNDLYTSVEEMKNYVDVLTDEEVLAHADEYKSVIPYVKDQIASLTQMLEQMDPADMDSIDARTIQAQLGLATEQLGLLKDRYVIYLERLSDMDVSLREYGF